MADKAESEAFLKSDGLPSAKHHKTGPKAEAAGTSAPTTDSTQETGQGGGVQVQESRTSPQSSPSVQGFRDIVKHVEHNEADQDIPWRELYALLVARLDTV